MARFGVVVMLLTIAGVWATCSENADAESCTFEKADAAALLQGVVAVQSMKEGVSAEAPAQEEKSEVAAGLLKEEGKNDEEGNEDQNLEAKDGGDHSEVIAEQDKDNMQRRGPTFFKHCNYRGSAKSVTRSINSVRKAGLRNDDVSSLIVPPGWRVTVFEHSNFRGSRRTFGPGSYRCFVRYRMGRKNWNDKVSSVRVSRTRRAVRRSRRRVKRVRTVALKTAHGKYVVAEKNGQMNANRPWLRSWEKFKMITHRDGTISLRSAHGKYVVAEKNGQLNANRRWMRSWEKFKLIKHRDGTISLRSAHGKYVAAERNGKLNVNRPWMRS